MCKALWGARDTMKMWLFKHNRHFIKKLSVQLFRYNCAKWHRVLEVTYEYTTEEFDLVWRETFSSRKWYELLKNDYRLNHASPQIYIHAEALTCSISDVTVFDIGPLKKWLN